MYATIRGKLSCNSPSYIVIEASGVGYKVFTPPHSLSDIALGQEVMVHTSFVVRENSQALYGFPKAEERDFFETLLDVSGIGPKLALNMIGALPLDHLSQAIVNRDIAVLSKIPGIGKKMAERLSIELKDKIPEFHGPGSFQINTEEGQKIKDALSALLNLGYNQNTAHKALKKTLSMLPEDADLSDMITHALKNI
jgi:Holliday junction DNA helicase RuvA